jgi:hypothetical protein
MTMRIFCGIFLVPVATLEWMGPRSLVGCTQIPIVAICIILSIAYSKRSKQGMALAVLSAFLSYMLALGITNLIDGATRSYV